jgi:short-chain Z-isoprenyl diphosphate synthase
LTDRVYPTRSFSFVEALGPDLREVDFLRAIRDFTSRERRFGG